MSFEINEGIFFDKAFKKRSSILDLESRNAKIFSMTADLGAAKGGLGSLDNERYSRAKNYPLVGRINAIKDPNLRITELIDVIPTWMEGRVQSYNTNTHTWPDLDGYTNEGWDFFWFEYNFNKGRGHDGGGWVFYERNRGNGRIQELANNDLVTNVKFRFTVIAI